MRKAFSCLLEIGIFITFILLEYPGNSINLLPDQIRPHSLYFSVDRSRQGFQCLVRGKNNSKMIWEYSHTKVPIEKAYPRNVEKLFSCNVGGKKTSQMPIFFSCRALLGHSQEDLSTVEYTSSEHGLTVLLGSVIQRTIVESGKQPLGLLFKSSLPLGLNFDGGHNFLVALQQEFI